MASESYRDLISGKARGLIPTLKRVGLHALSLPYRIGTNLRNQGFDFGLRQAHKVPALTIAVGNLTAGGTGKTPVVAYLANWFQSRGLRTAILSRGYKSLEQGANDEKLVLDRHCPGVPHLQQPDRVASAHQAIREHQSQVLVLDDAYQHRRIARDLNLLLIDATNPWGYGYLLPRGLLREPVQQMRRADLVVITRSDQVSESELQAIETRIARLRDDKPLRTRFVPTGWLTLGGEKLSLDHFHNAKTIAFCGLGNPAGFRETLESIDHSPAEFVTFPDHHHFTTDDIDRLKKDAAAANANVLMTTLKDLVKLPVDSFPELTVAALMIEWELVQGEDELQQRLEQLLDTM